MKEIKSLRPIPWEPFNIMLRNDSIIIDHARNNYIIDKENLTSISMDLGGSLLIETAELIYKLEYITGYKSYTRNETTSYELTFDGQPSEGKKAIIEKNEIEQLLNGIYKIKH